MDGADSKRGEIGLGDLIHAIRKLPQLTVQDIQQMVESLGFELDVSKVEQEASGRRIRGAWNRPHHRGSRPVPGKEPEFSSRPSMPPTREAQPELPERILASELEILDPADYVVSPVPASIDQIEPLQSLLAEPVARQRLFTNNTTRGLLVPAVAQPARGIEPDIPAIIDCFVGCRFLNSMPTRTRYTSRNGCHLLLDYSKQLTPWWPDMRDLIDQVHSILGEDSCPVFEFEGNPENAVCWTGGQEEEWKPVAGVPVLVASDLGLVSSQVSRDIRVPGYRPGNSVWRRFARRCASREVPVIALVPLDSEHWPKGLDRLIKLIHWNPATDAASVQRLLDESC